MADSFLNLEGKAALASPWDVHAAKLVDCVACHYARNDPMRTDAKRGTLRYLSTDPRRQGTAEYLVRPDHRLAAQGCRACHDPLRAHSFLPYRQRHMAALACQSCHASGSMAPAVEMMDATVVDARRHARGPVPQRRAPRRRAASTPRRSGRSARCSWSGPRATARGASRR